MNWRDDMHRAAVALALPGWTWHDGDHVDISSVMEPWTTLEPSRFAVHVHVERPGAGIQMDRSFVAEAAAEFFNDLMETGETP